MSKKGQRNDNIAVKGVNGLVAFAPTLEVAAQLLQAKVNPDDDTARITVLGPNGSRAFPNVSGAALLLGAKGNGHVKDDQLIFVKEGNVLYLVYGAEKVPVVETNKPIAKNWAPFVIFAAKLAGLPEADLVRMFPANSVNGNGDKPAEAKSVEPVEGEMAAAFAASNGNGEVPAKKARKRKAKTAEPVVTEANGQLTI